VFDILQPHLNISLVFRKFYVDAGQEPDFLSFLASHSLYLGPLEDQEVYGLEALPDVLVDDERVLGLTENFDELVVRQEVEPWEYPPFTFEIDRQRLLYFFEDMVGRLEPCLVYVRFNTVPNGWILVEILHLHTPGTIHTLELLTFDGHLFLNVAARKDWLEVHPSRLALYHDL